MISDTSKYKCTYTNLPREKKTWDKKIKKTNPITNKQQQKVWKNKIKET